LLRFQGSGVQGPQAPPGVGIQESFAMVSTAAATIISLTLSICAS
jgi:hypothetical protein